MCMHEWSRTRYSSRVRITKARATKLAERSLRVNGAALELDQSHVQDEYPLMQ